ncbi:MAG TPA: trigger factor [Aliiroseovarius sp.]|nr:trigger factor [Aliiroseovarius sp.]
MQVTETLNEGLKRGYKLVVAATDLTAKVEDKLKEAQPNIEMKGFRKGKVPMAMLKQQYGDQLMGEVIQESIDGAMGAHFDESGDRPAVQPEVKVTNEDWKPGDDIEVEFSYEKLPAIPDVDLKGIALERMEVKPGEAEIDEALASLAENAQNFDDKKKGSKAKEGDQVVIDFLGKVDGEAFEGGAAEDFPLVLGSGSFIPGFEDGLIGAKAGDELDVNVTFPADYGAENLAGKDAVFECKVKAVKKPVPAEINDELATKFGAENLDNLKEQISERLAQEYAGAARAVMKRALLDVLDEKVDFELPVSLVDAESKQIAHQLWHEEHPEDHGHDHPEIEPTDEHRRLAERRVRLGLLLAELGQKNNIEISDAEMTQAVMNEARKYPGQEKEFFEFVQQNAQVRQQLQAPLFEEKVVDYAFELADVTAKEVSKEDLEKAIEAMEDE